MRDAYIEELVAKDRELWNRYREHRALRYPKDAIVTFRASSRAKSESEGHVIGDASWVGSVRIRFHPRRKSDRFGNKIPEYKWLVRDIPITDIYTVSRGHLAP